MENIDLYKGLHLMRKSKIPFDVTFVKCSISKNEGGKIKTLERQICGPLKKNQNANLMIGLRSESEPNEISHIYIHSILNIKFADGQHFKLILNYEE